MRYALDSPCANVTCQNHEPMHLSFAHQDLKSYLVNANLSGQHNMGWL